MKKIENKYNPKDFENKLYEKWEKEGYFKPSMDKTRPAYSIVMPPPNVTGKLHIGHALDCTIQDTIIRTKRMQGFNTLWLQGSDHASIATAAKVVAKMKEEGLTKADIGRDAFLERAWEWTKEYGGEIQKQQRKMGCSCDWERSRFTLDEGLSNAVLEEFIKLYNDGLIYKGEKIINWCPNCHTAISNAEVEYEERPSFLWHARYKIVGEDNYIEIATTRPETILGDTAVAVNPKDERYTDLVGKKCIVPIVNREVPIIADEFVEMEFGTGCVKITPAHDPNDYEAGLRHNLDIIEVFDESSIMNDLVPEWKGMKSIDARELVVKRLEEEKALVSIEDYNHNVGTCYRCHGIVEPRISEQWFVAMKELAKPAIEAVKNGDIKFVPKKYEKTYFNWLENIQDWCISRQLWWGHRIPAYYCKECNSIVVSKEEPHECKKCGCKEFEQDPDTLDTWFSSALWPFSTMGWPDEEAEDFKTFYPTNALVTAYDIIFFWVVRMVFSGYYATKQKPFSDIVIHGIVRDSQGRKMSKSLGNGIDPLEVVDEYGADALRFSLLSGTTIGNDIKYMTEKLSQASNFANKIWNAAKFSINEEKNTLIENANNEKEWEELFKENELKAEDKWMIGKINELIDEVSKNINRYELGVAIDNLYSFIWDEFCDWYIEIVKPRLNNQEEKEVAYAVLNYSLKTLMKLLHPFMPFVTSEIYNHIKNDNEKELMLTSWPEKIELDCSNEIQFIEKMKNIITKVRNIRTNMNVHPSKKSELIFVTNGFASEIENGKYFINKLAFGENLKIQSNLDGIASNAISIAEDGIELFIPFNELVDIEEEKARLSKEKEKMEAEIKRSNGILNNQGFLAKAPEAKIQEEKEKLAKYEKNLNDINERLSKM